MNMNKDGTEGTQPQQPLSGYSLEELRKMGPERLWELCGNKSRAIRAIWELYGEPGKFDGYDTGSGELTVSEVAKLCGVIYQNVRNVLERPLKRKIKAERAAQRALQNGGSK